MSMLSGAWHVYICIVYYPDRRDDYLKSGSYPLVAQQINSIINKKMII
jgi:hypothetical protein